MALIIKANLPCNTVGFLSNKEKKNLLKIDQRRIAVRYDDIGIAILKPDLDYIAFGFSPTPEFMKQYDPASTVEKYKDHIKAMLFHDAKTLVDGLSFVEGVPFMKKPWSNYNLNLRFKPKSADESFLIQIAPKNENSNLSFMRFVVNPSKLPPEAFIEFQDFIVNTLVTTHKTVTYETFLIWSKVFRADVAVDILGARPSDMEIITLADGKPKPKKSHTYNSETGRMETIYPGTATGKTGGQYIYDKRQEQLDAGEVPIYGDFLHARFECRVTKTTFFKLSKINNRCARVSIRALDPKKFDKLHHSHALFVRYALLRTLSKALELIPEKLHPKFAASHAAVLRNIWDPKKLWDHWKQTVKTSGFFAFSE